MAKSIIVFFFLFIFAAAQVLPSVGLLGTDGRAYAGGMIGDLGIQLKYTGNIREINQDLRTIEVTKKVGGKDYTKTFVFDASTQVTSEAENKNISDLKTGDKVKVYYKVINRKYVASSISLEK